MVSSALQAAQERLLALREKNRSEQWADGNSKRFAGTLAHIASPSKSEERLQYQRPNFTLEIIKDETTDCPLSTNVQVQSEMATAVLREGYVGAARIWWLLRGMDDNGAGCFEKQVVKEKLAGDIGGWRRIRQLLCEGDGVFWVWDGERVWLRSLVKVAAELGIVRFSADPVSLPIDKLFGRISQVKANLYAIFHSTRDETPIARETLQDITGISASSQRNYEEQVGIRPKPQFALLQENLDEAAWQHGHAVFTFTDHLGKHGKVGQRWTARQLPNCYSKPFDSHTNKRNRKRLNRKLSDLLNQGTAGNGWQTIGKSYYAEGVGENGYFRGISGMWFANCNVSTRCFGKSNSRNTD